MKKLVFKNLGYEDGWNKVQGDSLHCLNNLLHNLNGPAVINADGSLEWWVNGVETDKSTIDMMRQEISAKIIEDLKEKAKESAKSKQTINK